MHSPTPACLHCGELLEAPNDTGLCIACRLEAILQDTAHPEQVSTEPASKCNETLGGYHLLEQIGRGGMGVIHKAFQPRLKRFVALKLLASGEFADAPMRQRLIREAQAMARLHHPNIVGVFDAGEDGGRTFLAMEYVPGRNLAQLVQAGLPTTSTAARYVRDLANAVHYAHDQGILHRDIKPSNVLVDPDDRPRLTDFGITRILNDAPGTQHTLASGTPGFMAPEQAGAGPGESGRFTDVFGLGALLYYLLTGRPPFQGASVAESLRALHEFEPAPPSTLRPGVPRELDAICLKCLEKDPTLRYTTAIGVAEDLVRWEAGLPVTAKPATALTRLLKWVRRRPLVTALAATSALFLAAGIAGVAWQWRKAVDNARVARLHSYLSGVLLAETDWRENNLGRMRQTLAEIAANPSRGFEWYLLQHWAAGSLTTVHAHEIGLNSLALSPDGSRVATVGLNTLTRLWDAAAGRQLAEWNGHADWISGVAFSPDGELLASCGGAFDIIVREVATGHIRFRLPHAHTHIVRRIAWAPDGSRLVSSSLDGFVRAWNGVDGSPVFEIPPSAPNLWAMGLAATPDGRAIISGHSDGRVRVHSLADGSHIATHRLHSGTLDAIAISPDGRRAASGGADGHVRIWDPASGRQLVELKVGSMVHDLAFSPDGQRLASAQADRIARVWDVTSGRELFAFRGHALDVRGVAFSPDGSRLFTAGGDGSLRQWDVTRDALQSTLVAADAQPTTISLSSDGSRLAVGTHSGEILLLDPANHGRIASLRHQHPIQSIAFLANPDRLLATDAQGFLSIWNLQSKERSTHVEVSPGNYTAVTPSPDGHVFALRGQEPAAGIWTLPIPRQRTRLPAHGNYLGVAGFSPDSKRLLTLGNDWTARIWDAEQGRLIAEFSKHKNLAAAGAFAPDGRHCLTASGDGMVILWDSITGRTLHRYDTRTLGIPGIIGSGGLLDAGFLPDGSRVYTIDSDAVLHLWHPELERETLRLRIPGIRTARFDPKGRYMVTLGAEVRLWPTATPARTEQALDQLGSDPWLQRD